MRTYPIRDQAGRLIAFEFPNSFITHGGIARILGRVRGVANIAVRPLFGSSWGDTTLRFTYHGRPFTIEEPSGDSRRYWVGPSNPPCELVIDSLLAAFTPYRPAIFR